MTTTPIAEDPLEILVRHVVDGKMNATPEGIAIIGWLCDFEATEPTIEEIISTSDGWLMARHGGEIGAEFLGPPDGFFKQIKLVCDNCGLTGRQAEKVMDIARRKIVVP